jgi:hypothetical protein
MVPEGGDANEPSVVIHSLPYDYHDWYQWLRAAVFFVKIDGSNGYHESHAVNDAVRRIIERMQRMTQWVVPGDDVDIGDGGYELEDDNTRIFSDHIARNFLFGTQNKVPEIAVLMALWERVYRPFLPPPVSSTVAEYTVDARIRRIASEMIWRMRMTKGSESLDIDAEAWYYTLVVYFELLDLVFRTHPVLTPGVCAAVDRVFQQLRSFVSRHLKLWNTVRFMWFALFRVRLDMCHPPRRLDPSTGESAVMGPYVPFEMAEAIRRIQLGNKEPTMGPWLTNGEKYGWTIDPSRPDRVLGVHLQDVESFHRGIAWHSQ